MTDEVQADILTFIEGRFPRVELGPHDDIFAIGFINSLFAMELVIFLETAFGFSIPNYALKIENFRTIAAMAELVRQHTTPVAQEAGSQ